MLFFSDKFLHGVMSFRMMVRRKKRSIGCISGRCIVPLFTTLAVGEKFAVRVCIVLTFPFFYLVSSATVLQMCPYNSGKS
jgi:uncharacterized membrane protein